MTRISEHSTRTTWDGTGNRPTPTRRGRSRPPTIKVTRRGTHCSTFKTEAFKKFLENVWHRNHDTPSSYSDDESLTATMISHRSNSFVKGTFLGREPTIKKAKSLPNITAYLSSLPPSSTFHGEKVSPFSEQCQVTCEPTEVKTVKMYYLFFNDFSKESQQMKRSGKYLPMFGEDRKPMWVPSTINKAKEKVERFLTDFLSDIDEFLAKGYRSFTNTETDAEIDIACMVKYALENSSIKNCLSEYPRTRSQLIHVMLKILYRDRLNESQKMVAFLENARIARDTVIHMLGQHQKDILDRIKDELWVSGQMTETVLNGEKTLYHLKNCTKEQVIRRVDMWRIFQSMLPERFLLSFVDIFFNTPDIRYGLVESRLVPFKNFFTEVTPCLSSYIQIVQSMFKCGIADKEPPLLHYIKSAPTYKIWQTTSSNPYLARVFTPTLENLEKEEATLLFKQHEYFKIISMITGSIERQLAETCAWSGMFTMTRQLTRQAISLLESHDYNKDVVDVFKNDLIEATNSKSAWNQYTQILNRITTCLQMVHDIDRYTATVYRLIRITRAYLTRDRSTPRLDHPAWSKLIDENRDDPKKIKHFVSLFLATSKDQIRSSLLGLIGAHHDQPLTLLRKAIRYLVTQCEHYLKRYSEIQKMPGLNCRDFNSLLQTLDGETCLNDLLLTLDFVKEYLNPVAKETKPPEMNILQYLTLNRDQPTEAPVESVQRKGSKDWAIPLVEEKQLLAKQPEKQRIRKVESPLYKARRHLSEGFESIVTTPEPRSDNSSPLPRLRVGRSSSLRRLRNIPTPPPPFRSSSDAPHPSPLGMTERSKPHNQKS